jgi:hypothetical protein
MLTSLFFGSGHRRALTSSPILTTRPAAPLLRLPTCSAQRKRWPRGRCVDGGGAQMPPESCPYCNGRDIRRGEVIKGACYGPNRIPPAGPRPRFIIYCGFCGYTTAVAGTWEEAEIWWAAAGALDGDFSADGAGRVYVPRTDPRDRTETSGETPAMDDLDIVAWLITLSRPALVPCVATGWVNPRAA